MSREFFRSADANLPPKRTRSDAAHRNLTEEQAESRSKRHEREEKAVAKTERIPSRSAETPEDKRVSQCRHVFLNIERAYEIGKKLTIACVEFNKLINAGAPISEINAALYKEGELNLLQDLSDFEKMLKNLIRQIDKGIQFLSAHDPEEVDFRQEIEDLKVDREYIERNLNTARRNIESISRSMTDIPAIAMHTASPFSLEQTKRKIKF